MDLEISCARWACALGNAKYAADSHLQILGVSRMRTWKPQLHQDFAPTNFRCVAHAHLKTPSALGKCTSKLCMRKLLHLEMSHVRLLGALGIRKCVDVRTQESQIHRVSQQPAHSGIPSALVASNPGILDPPAWCIRKSHVRARLLGKAHSTAVLLRTRYHAPGMPGLLDLRRKLICHLNRTCMRTYHHVRWPLHL